MGDSLNNKTNIGGGDCWHGCKKIFLILLVDANLFFTLIKPGSYIVLQIYGQKLPHFMLALFFLSVLIQTEIISTKL